uniref:Uncharacterized protein n=1 Tax=Panagrolaimus superbus TaxID=310955 RepID=A0A914Z8L1_9BILA
MSSTQHQQANVQPSIEVAAASLQPQPQRQVQPSSSSSTSNEAENEKDLKYGAAHVIRLFAPVSLCMALVIFTMNTIGYFSRDDGVYL